MFSKVPGKTKQKLRKKRKMFTHNIKKLLQISKILITIFKPLVFVLIVVTPDFMHTIST